ncbi:uncharacterized protein LAJ45_06316 [Morchella importuna]|uniref:uncharacterized protein n=1 Tax=Morchella importuna TaxID=1174673 RepID=UPI001E8E5C21|nr:uncharacterized protein LAJ45_06316 [Morchella importuna]KAH8149685.1 hypothetical protein LAJ45_06316 [Morchella importuna]
MYYKRRDALKLGTSYSILAHPIKLPSWGGGCIQAEARKEDRHPEHLEALAQPYPRSTTTFHNTSPAPNCHLKLRMMVNTPERCRSCCVSEDYIRRANYSTAQKSVCIEYIFAKKFWLMS